MTDHVTVFSNGVADIRRVHEVDAGGTTTVAIPVEVSHLGDVLASLTVTGQGVGIAGAATYRPANDTPGTFDVDPDDVMVSLAAALAGAQVTVHHGGGERTAGTLMGLDTVRQRTDGGDIEVRHLVVHTTDRGVRRFALAQIEGLAFEQSDVRAEIDRALRRRYERIAPQRTTVELTLTADQPARAVVGYTIPAAAWKMSYRLLTDVSGAVRFEGTAIVDNNTEHDWTDVDLAVVTGEPLTFSTDLADAKVPRRGHVDVVTAVAPGAVEAGQGFPAQAPAGPPGSSGAARPLARAAAPADMALMAAEEPGPGAPPLERALAGAGPAAEFAAAEVADAGDFSVFRSPAPVSIAAHHSAVIPMFSLELADAGVVAHYRTRNHAERPHRAVRFTNEAAFALRRGPCTVYEGGVFQGTCLLPALRAGERALLPHAVETGVRVRADRREPRHQLTSLEITDGWYISSTERRQDVEYTFVNAVDRAHTVVLDHDVAFAGDVTARVDVDGATTTLDIDERLADGVRFVFDLPAGATAVVLATETRVLQQRIDITDVDHWGYVEQAIAVDEPIMREALRDAIARKEQLDASMAQRDRLRHESKVLQDKQVRLRENIGAAGAHPSANEWRTELAATERRITEIETRLLPELERVIEEQRAEVEDALRASAAQWSS